MIGRAFWAAFRNTLPVLAAYGPLGIVFGLVFQQAGFAWYWGPLMSLFVFGGSLQFLALGMLTGGASLLALGLAALPVAIRNTFYNVILVDRLKGRLWRRLYMAFGMVDSTFSILSCESKFEAAAEDRYAFWVCLITHFYWVTGTLIGAVVGIFLPVHLPGLEFSLTALFAALATENFLTTRRRAPLLVSGLAILLALWIAPKHLLLVGMLIALVVFIFGEVRAWSTR